MNSPKSEHSRSPFARGHMLWLVAVIIVTEHILLGYFALTRYIEYEQLNRARSSTRRWFAEIGDYIVEDYIMRNSRYPSRFTDLLPLFVSTRELDFDGFGERFDRGVDPWGNVPMMYRDIDNRKFILVSLGPDGVHSDDDIVGVFLLPLLPEPPNDG